MILTDIFGDITPALLIVLVTLIVQFIKAYTQDSLSSRHMQLIALLVTAIIMLPYQIFQLEGELLSGNVFTIARSLFASVIYTILSWFSAIGFYEVGIKSRSNLRSTMSNQDKVDLA